MTNTVGGVYKALIAKKKPEGFEQFYAVLRATGLAGQWAAFQSLSWLTT